MTTSKKQGGRRRINVKERLSTEKLTFLLVLTLANMVDQKKKKLIIKSQHMNFFKRLFNRNKTTETKETEITKNKEDNFRWNNIGTPLTKRIENPTYSHLSHLADTMGNPKLIISDDANLPIYPFLTRRDAGYTVHNSFIVPFLHREGEEMPEVFINLVQVEEDHFTSPDTTDMEEDFFWALHNYALKNLNKIEDIPTAFLQESENKIVVCADVEFVSETILSKMHMLKIHQLLESDDLLVSVPRRGVLIACSKNESDEVTEKLAGLTYIFYKDENLDDCLTTDVFWLHKGEIRANVPLKKKNGDAL